MESEQKSDGKARFFASKQDTARAEQKRRDGGVKNDIEGVIAPRLETVNGVVPTERQSGQRSIRLVRVVAAKGNAPEIVREYRLEGR